MKFQNPLQNSILRRWPAGNIYQGYGENVELYRRFAGIDGHNGIDIARGEGTPVGAAHDGIIVEMYRGNVGYGNHVRIVSNKEEGIYYETIYGHLENFAEGLKIDDRVTMGQVIGYEGNTGFVISGSTPYWGNAPAGKGVHLHWGLRKLSDPVDGTMQVIYGGGNYHYTILNFDNGLKGYVDPMLYLLSNLENKNNEKNMIVDYPKLNQIYNEILFRDPDELANGYLGQEEEFVRAEIGKSEERQRIIRIVNLARMFKLA